MIFLGNVLPRQVQKKKLFRACFLWQDCTILHVYQVILKAQTAQIKEPLFRNTEATPGVGIKTDSHLRATKPWNVVGISTKELLLPAFGTVLRIVT